MKLYLARHTLTNYNEQHLCNADPNIDVYITEQGKVQAKKLADSLKNVPIDRIFVSELRRTKQTADIVNAFHNAPVQIAPLLNDHNSGFEGKPFMLLSDALDAAENKWTASFNGGESIEDVKRRVADFLESLSTQPYDAVLVVTSKWLIRAAVAVIKNVPLEEVWELDPEQGGYIELELPRAS